MKYSELDNKLKRRSHSIFSEILQKNSKSKSPKILDVGCASGIIGKIRKSPKNIIGIESDLGLLKLAEKNCEKVYNLDLNDFTSSKIKENNFDFVFLGDILEHLLKPELALKEVLKLMSRDGYIIISLPNIAQIQFRLKLLSGKFNYTETGVLDKTHLHLYTYKTARDFILENNLKIVDFYPSGTIVSFFNVFPRLLSSQLIFLCRKESK